MKTFIKWSGNKSKHLRHLLPHVPENITGRYIEPFIGSGALFLHLSPDKWIINDLNKDLVNIWNTVKDNPDFIINEFKKFSPGFKRKNKENKVKQCKEITSTIEDLPYDKHRATVYLLMTACVYNGILIKKNKLCFQSLEMNISCANKYPFLKDTYYTKLLQISQFLNESSGKIYNKDYTKILSKAKENDFVFLDPPYIEKHDYKFNYNIGEVLDDTFLDSLYQQVTLLDSKKVKWLMTQADTKQIKSKFKKYKITEYPVYRNSQKKFVNELLIRNY